MMNFTENDLSRKPIFYAILGGAIEDSGDYKAAKEVY